MQTTKFDGTIDMNAFAAVLSLAPKNGEGATAAYLGMNSLGREWIERTNEMAPANDWDPWSAESK